LPIARRGLGSLFLLWTDEENVVLRSITTAQWMDFNSTWVMGLPIPDSICYPALSDINSDHSSHRSKDPSYTGDYEPQCGMENVLLPWTPEEYIYQVLQFNKTSLPTEALQVLRFYSCKVWHTEGMYDNLCAPQDIDIKDLVA